MFNICFTGKNYQGCWNLTYIYYYNTTDLSTLRIIAYSTQGNSTYHSDIYTVPLFTMIGL